MKNITIAICALMLNSVFALDLPKPALEKSAKVDLVVEIPKTALEELVLGRVRGNEPLATLDNCQKTRNTGRTAIETVVTKDNINRDLGLLVYNLMTDFYNRNLGLLGQVPSLKSIQKDENRNIDIIYQEDIGLFPCLESILLPQSNKIKEIASKPLNELSNDEREFRDKIVNKCFGLFIIQLFLNKDLMLIAQCLAIEEGKLRESMNIIDPNWKASINSFYKSTHKQETLGIYRIANLAIINISSLLENIFPKLSEDAYDAISGWQRIFECISSTEIDMILNSQSMLEQINSMNSKRIIIRSSLNFLYDHTFADKIAYFRHFISVYGNQLTDKRDLAILRALMLEVCVKANYTNYRVNTGEEEDSLDKKDDEYKFYMMSIIKAEDA